MPTNLTSKLKFLERHQLLKHAQESLNSPVSIKEIEFVVKRPQGRKLHIKMTSLFNSAIYLGKNINSFIQSLSENWREGNISHLILWDQYYPDTKTDKKSYKKTKPISFINTDTWKTSIKYSQHVKRMLHYDQVGLSPVM